MSYNIPFPRLFRLDATRTCWYCKYSPPLLHGLHVSLQNKLAIAAGHWLSGLADAQKIFVLNELVEESKPLVMMLWRLQDQCNDLCSP